MTGRYLILLYKTHSGISTHTYFRSFMFTHTCPFRQPVGWHLPRQAGTAFLYESFLYFCFCYIKTWLLFSLALASPALGGKCRALRGDRGMFAYTGQNVMAKQTQLCRHSWAAGKTGMIIKEKTDYQRERRIRHRLSENAFIPYILCPDSSLYLVLFYYSIPDRFLRPFKNDRQVFNIIL